MTRGVRGAAKSRAQPNVFARPGVWQLEAWCGRCGWGEACGAPQPERGDPLAPLRRCTRPGAFVDGRPKGACAWALSFVWLYVPREDA